MQLLDRMLGVLEALCAFKRKKNAPWKMMKHRGNISASGVNCVRVGQVFWEDSTNVCLVLRLFLTHLLPL